MMEDEMDKPNLAARETETHHTPGPWSWAGEDYRAGWGWQMLVGAKGEGIIVGQALDGGPYEELRAWVPLDPSLCITGMAASGKPHAECVHVFGAANARLIAAAPEMLEALKGLLQHMGIADAAPEDVDEEDRERERAARAAIAKAEGRAT